MYMGYVCVCACMTVSVTLECVPVVWVGVWALTSACLSPGTQQPPSLRDTAAPGSPMWHRACPCLGGEAGGSEGAQLRARPHPAGAPSLCIVSLTWRGGHWSKKPSTCQMFSGSIVNASHQLLKGRAPSFLKKAAAAEECSGYLSPRRKGSPGRSRALGRDVRGQRPRDSCSGPGQDRERFPGS